MRLTPKTVVHGGAKWGEDGDANHHEESGCQRKANAARKGGESGGRQAKEEEEQRKSKKHADMRRGKDWGNEGAATGNDQNPEYVSD